GVVQDGKDRGAFDRRQELHLLAGVEDDAGDGMAVGLVHGLGQDGIGLLADRAIGEQVVRPAAGIERVERFGSDELGDGDGVVGCAAELVELGGIDDHVLVLGVFVARNDGVVLDFTVERADLVVADAAGGGGVGGGGGGGCPPAGEGGEE